MAIHLSPNFPLSRLTKSATATRMGLSNEPTAEHQANLKKLVEKILEPAEAYLGTLEINSGYRSLSVNAAVKGSRSSQHCKGEAADIECPRVGNRGLARWIALNCEFDQLILEGYKENDPNSGWVHVSYKEGANRKQMMTCEFPQGRKPVYTNVDLRK